MFDEVCRKKRNAAAEYGKFLHEGGTGGFCVYGWFEAVCYECLVYVVTGVGLLIVEDEGNLGEGCFIKLFA